MRLTFPYTLAGPKSVYFKQTTFFVLIATLTAMLQHFQAILGSK